MKVLVVILNYGVTDLTIDCLHSLADEVGRVAGMRVAVCENGTGGDAAERLRQAIDANGWAGWADLTVVYPNRGFTGGNNVVIRAALDSDDPPEYVILLNADTVVQPGSMATLVEFMESHPQAGIAGSLLLSPEGDAQASAFRFRGIATELDGGLRLGVVSRLLSPWGLVLPTPTEDRTADWVPGASMILRTSMLRQIGLLDEGLYTYMDDVDICLRARRAGWETWVVPRSRVVHLEGASTGVTRGTVAARAKRRPAYWFQARRRFFLKSYGGAYTAVADAVFILAYATYRVRRWVQRKPDTDPPRLLTDSIRHSVFLTGFRVTDVENPALRAAAQEIPSPAGASSREPLASLSDSDTE
jgi:GT2 family glycosyltransferase